MLPYLTVEFGNPSSAHSVGAKAATAVAIAREELATLVGADSRNITFCSSATEASNTVIRSAKAGTIISTVVEHPANLRPLEDMQKAGRRVIYLSVDSNGQFNTPAFEESISDDTTLVSVMWVNNETGVIFPIEDIAEICARKSIPLHVDAAQAAGKLSIDMRSVPIDYLTLSAHKIFGPKGVGALIRNADAKIHPLFLGGTQEAGLRPGTENVPGIVGFGVAATLAKHEQQTRMNQATHCRDLFEVLVLKSIERCWINGAGAKRVGNTANIGFDGVDGDAIVTTMDAAGICLSTGSACHSSTTEPSHVIQAMSGSYTKAKSSVRFSLSHLTTEDDIRAVALELSKVVSTLRENG